MPDKLTIYTDGASRNNPGPASIGVVIKDTHGKILAEISKRIGNATNNQAEYHAIIAALEKAITLGASEVMLKADSELVVKQLKGSYKVKNTDLKPLFEKVLVLSRRFTAFNISYIPREENKEADRLANKAFETESPEPKREQYGVSIRRTTHADYEALYPVFAELDDMHTKALPQVFRKVSQQNMSQYLDSVLASEDAVMFLAESRGQIVGFIRLKIEQSPDIPLLQPRRYAKISDVGVKKAYHRRGIGKALMQSAEKWATEKGVDKIQLNVWEFNKGASAFYQELGYATASRVMWKEISPS
jgi:ribonuclease HI